MSTDSDNLEIKKTDINSATIEIDNSPISNSSATTNDVPDFGWSSYAERMNGRFAMIGFISLILIEIISDKGFLHWAGLIN